MVLGLVLSLGWTVAVLQRSDFVTAANTFVDQPVQFSHQHHVGGIGIDCRYCHTSVEQAASASIPPTKTCMNCHSQIWVDEPVPGAGARELPRPTSRSAGRASTTCPTSSTSTTAIHVKKGVGCETCHGRVDQMPLHAAEELAADGVVPELPPQSRAVRASA